jgi:GTP cyclohydrolase I
MDLTDDSIKGTPNRVAKMFVKEILGIKPERKPKASTFDNNYKYGEMLVEKQHYRLFDFASIITNYRKSSCSLHL